MRLLWSACVALSLAAAKPAASQVAVYADFTAAKLTNLTTTSILYGPTIGLTAQIVDLAHLKISGDMRISILGGAQRLDGIAFGPKFGFAVKGLKPYAEILVGFDRYNDGRGTSVSSTTDGQLQANFGVDKRLGQHIDWRIAEFSYEQYYALGGQFNPKNFSTGIVYRFGAQ